MREFSLCLDYYLKTNVIKLDSLMFVSLLLVVVLSLYKLTADVPYIMAVTTLQVSYEDFV